jgi:hypothetical protein
VRAYQNIVLQNIVRAYQNIVLQNIVRAYQNIVLKEAFKSLYHHKNKKRNHIGKKSQKKASEQNSHFCLY